jgi:hypothetical protein
MRPFLAAAIWKATTPPKGPTGFAHFIKQTFLTPPTVPVQVVPAATSTVRGCGRRSLVSHLCPFRFEP